MSADLNHLYSTKRTGAQYTHTTPDNRTAFQRDYDRIIFSSAFRRLQNKTQVFPLPGSVFVHNRLTHSLEVSSVGRSLGTLAGEYIANEYAKELSPDSQEFYRYGLSYVISAACLCHDIGNPAFGHSGEDAIASYFVQNEKELQQNGHFSAKEWSDFIHFEGNANAMRLLTQQQNGKSEGGLLLTYSTLCAIAKYPCESLASTKDFLHRKKFGFFQSEKELFADIAQSTGMRQESTTPLIYKRHPFVWLVEAADDICYNIIDMEDAHRLHIIEHQDCVEMFLALLEEFSSAESLTRAKDKVLSIADKNDQISFLRAKSISILVEHAIKIYAAHFEQILEGSHDIALFDSLANTGKALTDIEDFSKRYIYDNRAVVEIENAGYNVLSELLHHFVTPILKDKNALFKSEEKALLLIPEQFRYIDQSKYQQVMGVLDYISGMTDNYATELYRKIKGIEIGKIG